MAYKNHYLSHSWIVSRYEHKHVSFLPILTVLCHSWLAWACKSWNIPVFCGQQRQWQMERPITLPLVQARGVKKGLWCNRGGNLMNQTLAFCSAGCTTSPAWTKRVWGTLAVIPWHLQCVQSQLDHSCKFMSENRLQWAPETATIFMLAEKIQLPSRTFSGIFEVQN